MKVHLELDDKDLRAIGHAMNTLPPEVMHEIAVQMHAIAVAQMQTPAPAPTKKSKRK